MLRPDLDIPNSLISNTDEKKHSKRLLIIENAPTEITNSIVENVRARKFDFNCLILDINTIVPEDKIENSWKALYTQTDFDLIWSNGYLKVDVPTNQYSFGDVILLTVSWISNTKRLYNKSNNQRKA
jgi:hypothetical protein